PRKASSTLSGEGLRRFAALEVEVEPALDVPSASRRRAETTGADLPGIGQVEVETAGGGLPLLALRYVRVALGGARLAGVAVEQVLKDDGALLHDARHRGACCRVGPTVGSDARVGAAVGAGLAGGRRRATGERRFTSVRPRARPVGVRR